MGNPDPLASWAELSHNINMYFFFYFLVVPVMTYSYKRLCTPGIRIIWRY